MVWVRIGRFHLFDADPFGVQRWTPEIFASNGAPLPARHLASRFWKPSSLRHYGWKRQASPRSGGKLIFRYCGSSSRYILPSYLWCMETCGSKVTSSITWKEWDQFSYAGGETPSSILPEPWGRGFFCPWGRGDGSSITPEEWIES